MAGVGLCAAVLLCQAESLAIAGGQNAAPVLLRSSADVELLGWEQVQATRTASERRRVKRQVNQRFLTAMLDMGINLERAELALCETGNVGVEVWPVRTFCFTATQRARTVQICSQHSTVQL